ncbi:MAG: small ribosomal subunit Rsm22 family protein [Chlamydiota bacterium]
MDFLSRVEKVLEEEHFVPGKKEQKSLTKKYKDENFSLTMEEKYLYLLTRMPATVRVIRRVLQELDALEEKEKIKNILDVGSGPGSSFFALEEFFPDVEKITYIERDPDFIRLGKKLTQASSITWERKDCAKNFTLPVADLTLFSYSIGEMSEDVVKKIFCEWSQHEGLFLVLIEPGTPKGFSKIAWAKEFFLSYPFSVVAPCPHGKKCPLIKDFCHFSTRVNRSSSHRMAKEGSLGYEDEKFSYIIFSKKAGAEGLPRILRHPLKRKGHMIFSLCTSEGLLEKTVSRKDEGYKAGKKLEWGDRFSINKC